MELSGWGRFPRVDAQVAYPADPAACARAVAASPGIARGLGRAYGDSALADDVVAMRGLDRFHAFDPDSGLLSCDAGVSLDEILTLLVPRGWFLPVTPGTRFVTVGGAIASDVHGKNHHVDGTFGDHVVAIDLLLGNGEVVRIGPDAQPDLFHATCGGMGLTGVILSATIRMRKIRSSLIRETTVRARDLDAILAAFETYGSATYSAAWIDCLARGKNLGRSLLMLGEHADEGPLTPRTKPPRAVPFDMPSGLLNRATGKAFNALFYARGPSAVRTRTIPYEPHFHPLDGLAEWNRLYGRQGFVQYQFVLPGAQGLRRILETIAMSGQGAFLAVLKQFGRANRNLLSFPTEGYTLALDFKAEPAVFALLDLLDRAVLDLGGRIYLAKDARMSEAMFKASYPNWQAFQEVRARHHAIGRFASHQSKRLGLI
ncbi:FAD-binding oxidoreductase [Sphingomonas crocodyli]|uniref:FAD-binding oxidoreductase n=1 Tax=Sphingomonas crocodyli TaxID=1979270 RepID=A0A437LUY2_9SPHN|nr:FAD-binding oxidoreductase [Sphingomonas crocodyli]RVT89199.1 FAD-binding oxidoreductase [Sphingomonas crocodyli]